ncbi:hypothetical protein ABFS82_06G111600 [Erythranthe guttata]|uniref:Bifunctional inhibitor/plant lipid transfer protein/seed storage helical domain-containing protein n=1 Tax=Erythranthe guttata TaxID=4155 RepID=A0A022PZ86_ERYGU|nr:PREDICTED: stamen-specific protein FIL1-like [Erythranthe guttata]EYU19525.1 hypothetical protein MIMGU_mgv1a017062mg [Erythranthe guttata]|eukprot:XP_012858489.1 PREDICTED: stamen-specific protein FIL1-like [Erythranthe guttata]
MKYNYFPLVVMIIVVLLAHETQIMTRTQAQSTCASTLASLNVCAQFVVPGGGAATPSPDCCGALQAVNHDCLCSTLRIASRIPTQCNLPPLTCAN